MSRWINTRGWLRGYVPEKNKRTTNNENLNKYIETKSTLVRLVLRCPKCKSLKLKCYGADRPILYYKCNECGWKFKVLEIDR